MKANDQNEAILIKGARQHNLKNIDAAIPINSLTVITGLSGSGKSSLAFDTIYAEGQRRYVESLSAYARQFLGVMHKPDVDSIKGLSPAIAIQQKKLSQNPRSTVGTVTEIYDYLRLLFARIGIPHCPQCGQIIVNQDAQSIAKQILADHAGSRLNILAPLVRDRKGTYDYVFPDLKRQGFTRVRVDGVFFNLGTESILLKRYQKHTIDVLIDRVEARVDEKSRLHEAVEKALARGNGLAIALIEKKRTAHDVKKDGAKPYEEKLFSKHLACVDCGINFDELQPRMFSFNAPQGACPDCHGLGVIQEFDEELVVPNRALSIRDGAIVPWMRSIAWVRHSTLETLSREARFSLIVPFQDLPSDVQKLLLHGDAESGYEGVIPQLKRYYHQTQSEDRRFDIAQFMREKPCAACFGKRLRKESLAVTIQDKSIIDVTDLSIRDVSAFFSELKLSDTRGKIGSQIIKEIVARVSFLLNVGLEYLTLSRRAGTLSGGEAQRINLATQIGSELRGVLYILDEPSIGLHQRDNARLLATLKHLRDIGNTVIVVEHDEDTIRAADYVLDIGPGAGIHGGEIVAQGTPAEIIRSRVSLTGRYLSGKESIPVPSRRRNPRGSITLIGANEHNLKSIDVSFPLSVFCCVTGVSGSGKSTLVAETLFPILAQRLGIYTQASPRYQKIEGTSYLDKVIIIDQNPIGRTPRSNPATYTGVFTYIRELFSSTKESKMRGYAPGRFSFNVEEGRCGNCQGDGVIKIEMHFLPDVYIPCEVCNGKRYDEETLSIMYKEKTIADVLSMTVEEALQFFRAIPRIQGKLQTLFDVGLGYIQLGQSATTLSGGEAQRIKLAGELSRRDTGRTLYILDEPTTGLHFEDIKKLLSVLNRLVDKGNTVLIIEHNLDVIKTADHIIDLGPEGGSGGGSVIVSGTPEQVSKAKESHTGQFLKHVLQ
ncbi:excinuclease ABC subunit UvrA [Candidatus Uhrbacteria bacterium]|nr:excinuclease ABC subunit UvrA [Candidatus Uhrbacteria bacterium]